MASISLHRTASRSLWHKRNRRHLQPLPKILGYVFLFVKDLRLAFRLDMNMSNPLISLLDSGKNIISSPWFIAAAFIAELVNIRTRNWSYLLAFAPMLWCSFSCHNRSRALNIVLDPPCYSHNVCRDFLLWQRRIPPTLSQSSSFLSFLPFLS